MGSMTVRHTFLNRHISMIEMPIGTIEAKIDKPNDRWTADDHEFHVKKQKSVSSDENLSKPSSARLTKKQVDKTNVPIS